MAKAIDLTGQRVGKLTVISRAENKGTHAGWLCECDCGDKNVVAACHLRHAKNPSRISCGKRLCASASNDLKGKVFGRLVVKTLAGKNKQGLLVWRCECECGRESRHVGMSLVAGDTTSCGCLKNELIQKRATRHELTKEAQRRHGTLRTAAEEAGISYEFLSKICQGKRGVAAKYYPVKNKVLGNQTPDSIRRKRQHLCDFCQVDTVEVTNHRLSKRNESPQDCAILCSPECMSAWDRGLKRQLPDQGIMWDLPKPPKERQRDKETVAIAETVKMARSK